MLPAGNLATPVNPCFNAMHHHRPVIAAPYVILARPHHVNRSAPLDRFHHLRHLRCPVRRGARPSPKAASAQKRVDLDLLGFHPQKLRSDHLIERLQLRARPYFRAVAMKLDHAIHRFHGRVREKRKCVLGFDRLCRARQSRSGVSATFRGNARLLHQLAILFKHLGRGALLRPGIVPGNFERVSPSHRRPCILRENSNAGRDLHHFDDSIDLLRICCVERGHFPTEAIRTFDNRGQHSRTSDIQRENGFARGFSRRVEPREFRSNEVPILRGFKRHVLRHRHVHRVGRQFS